jgi:hypothetical protein
MLLPAVYQHHAIVMETRYEEGDWILKVADFSGLSSEQENETTSTSPPKKSLHSNTSSQSCIRVYETPAKHWKTVEYDSHGFTRHFHRPGTSTTASSSPPGLVRARLEFLLQHPQHLPPYSALHSNCECVAVWCKTGTWATVQTTSWLSLTAAGQAKSAATLAGVAASTQVTVPAAGLWGWLGYTTHVSLATANPLVIPVIAVYGAVTVGAPTVLLWRVQKQWKEITIQLNEAFWESAVDQPDVFVECITEWSNVPDRI